MAGFGPIAGLRHTRCTQEQRISGSGTGGLPGSDAYVCRVLQFSRHLDLAEQKHRQLPYRGKRMTVKLTNRSHRVAYIVGLLLLAVALTTALVLAAEHDSRGDKQALRQTILTDGHSLPQGPIGWECI